MRNNVRLFMHYFILTLSTISFLFVTPSYALSDDPAYWAEATMPLGERNYIKLRDALPLYQNAVNHPWPYIQSNRLLKKGMHSNNIPLVRARLSATNELPEDYNRQDNLYDKELVEAVKLFQERNGLKNDGIIGEATLEALNVRPEVRLKQIEINMQRWNQLSSSLNDRFIIVNIPDFRLHAYENNLEVLTMKAIVGKPEWQTPEMQSKIFRLVFNRAWNVPVNIAQKELVKKAMSDPNYLEDNHIKIYENPEENAEQIHQDSVNWRSARANGFPYHFRQDPGEENSLGLVKFEFKNKDDVYLHDTPAKELFNQDLRDLSHGCVRLENAFALVEFLMRDNLDWDDDRMQEILDSGKTKYVKASRPTPILITYITAWVGDDGGINFRNDVYGKDN